MNGTHVGRVLHQLHTWSPIANCKIMMPSFRVTFLIRKYLCRKCVSWDGRYRLHGVQASNGCHLTYMDTMAGKETFFRFPTPHMQDRDFLASFVHEDKLVLIASSHKIVLWDPSKNQLELQEFSHPTRDNPPKMTTISVRRLLGVLDSS